VAGQATCPPADYEVIRGGAPLRGAEARGRPAGSRSRSLLENKAEGPWGARVARIASVAACRLRQRPTAVGRKIGRKPRFQVKVND